jgi:hypothetical protein
MIKIIAVSSQYYCEVLVSDKKALYELRKIKRIHKQVLKNHSTTLTVKIEKV